MFKWRWKWKLANPALFDEKHKDKREAVVPISSAFYKPSANIREKMEYLDRLIRLKESKPFTLDINERLDCVCNSIETDLGIIEDYLADKPDMGKFTINTRVEVQPGVSNEAIQNITDRIKKSSRYPPRSVDFTKSPRTV
ncbi:hypothetical protein [Paenibacillus chibensis]|uniref:hypothetical protein n=1 Tax=Paenibacillus chibensis TaxID=59846 RepID=UPI000FD88A14|nr:hypothetical protein [Paenibacillus chibensis]MEC0370874.1 hypothetical protein [Paenibacillus chibensis]